MSKYRLEVKKGTVERLTLAMGQDASIACSFDEVAEHRGNTEAYLVELGMTPADLRKLERVGFAVRGREPLKSGWRVKWVIMGPKVEEAASGGTNVTQEGSNS